eukprot:CAMPEP_0119318144 /NCGR_PEP_ID=MMETSP1333-20130426/45523_1 /TAXON_ID=418940 /ORGANISM="Scyphosphaera apsteinii, Strain RCC1455" /LENGTH=186 /DNA_ID=CAMNT_0007324269 /DNA_START=515 /DNA_END=1077 /DNA_ORIENTATION=+
MRSCPCSEHPHSLLLAYSAAMLSLLAPQNAREEPRQRQCDLYHVRSGGALGGHARKVRSPPVHRPAGRAESTNTRRQLDRIKEPTNANVHDVNSPRAYPRQRDGAHDAEWNQWKSNMQPVSHETVSDCALGEQVNMDCLIQEKLSPVVIDGSGPRPKIDYAELSKTRLELSQVLHTHFGGSRTSED